MSKWIHRITAIDVVSQTGDCASCGKGVPLAYHRTRGQWLCRVGRNGRRADRSPAKRHEYNLRHKFGLTVEMYDALLDAQGGTCAICDGPCATGRRLAVDHDHESGAVRGLLCGRCNRALGLFGDDPAVVARAAQYLTR